MNYEIVKIFFFIGINILIQFIVLGLAGPEMISSDSSGMVIVGFFLLFLDAVFILTVGIYLKRKLTEG